MKTDDTGPLRPDGTLDTLLLLVERYPVGHAQLNDLYLRHGDLIIVETILHIAMADSMPLWAAEQQWVEWWKDNKLEDCPGELYQITVVLDKDLDTTPVYFGMVVKGGKVVQAAPISRWQVGRTLEQVREWVKEKGGTIERVEG